MTNSTSQRPNYGALALIGMGWLELAVSLVLFLMKLYPVAIAFGFASLLISLLAMLIGPMSAAGREPRRRVIPARTAAPSPAVAWTIRISVALAAVALIAAVILVVLGHNLAAIASGLWTLALGVQALRLRTLG